MTKKYNLIKIFVITFALMAIFAVSAYAATSDELETYYDTYGIAHGSGLTAPTVSDGGDGVDVSRSEVTFTETDYVIKGKNGFNIPIIRRYSNDAYMGFIYEDEYNSKREVPAYLAYYYYNTNTNTRILVGFANEFDAFKYKDGFKGVNHTTKSQYSSYNEYFYKVETLLSSTGTYEYERDTTSGPIVIKDDSYFREAKQTIIYTDQYIKIGSGWAIAKPGLCYLGERDSGSAVIVNYQFQDIYGKSCNLDIRYRDTDESYESTNETFLQSHRNYTCSFVDSSDIPVTQTHPQGFTYNFIVESKDGIKYYFYFEDYYNYYLRGIEDRFGNVFKCLSSSAVAQYLEFVDCTNNVTYYIDKTGIYVTVGDVRTQLVDYSYTDTTSSEDLDDVYICDNTPALMVSKNVTTSDETAGSDSFVTYTMIRKLAGTSFLYGGASWNERNMIVGHYIDKVNYSNGLSREYEYQAVSTNYFLYRNIPVTTIETYNNTQYNKHVYTYDINYTRKWSNDIYIFRCETETAEMANHNRSDAVETIDKYVFDDKVRLTSHKMCKSNGVAYKTDTYTYNCTCFDSPYATHKTSYSSGTTSRSYTYDTYHKMTKSTVGEIVTQYTYGAYNQITQILQNKDASTEIKTINTLTTDTKSIAETAVYENDALKSKTSYTYNTDGTVASENAYHTSSDVATTTYAYAYPTNGNTTVTATKTGIEDADGEVLANIVTQTTTDLYGNVISTKDGNGNISSYEYDLRGRLTKVTNPNYSTVTYSYNDVTNVTESTDACHNVIRVTFDPWGNMLETAYKENGQYKVLEKASYDYRNRLSEYRKYTSNTDYSKAVYTYDFADRMLTETVSDTDGNALRTVTYTYAYASDSNSRPLYTVSQQVSGSGETFAKTSVTTDYLDRQVSKVITDTDGNTRTYSYTTDYFGNVLTATAPDGTFETYTYDYSGKILSHTDQDDFTEYYSYNMAGLKTMYEDRYPNRNDYYYDKAGRVIKHAYPAGGFNNGETKCYYDANGNLIRESVKVTNNSQRNTDYVYDNMNRLSYVKTYPDSATTEITQYFYDFNGNVTDMVVGLSAPIGSILETPSTAKYISYSYDALGRCTQVDGNLSVTKSYEYDRAGNVVGSIGYHGSVTNTYDPFGNITSISKSGATTPEATYAYNALGLRTSMTDDSGTTAYTYDDFGNLLTETKGDIIKTSLYDNMNRRTSFNITKANEPILSNTYTHTIVGNIGSVTSNGKTANYGYDDNCNLVAISGDGFFTERFVDYGNVVKNIQNSYNNNVISEFATEYDLSGNVISVTDVNNNYTTNYTYDGVGRLKTEERNGADDLNHIITYTYDNLGNRQSKTTLYRNDNTTETITYTETGWENGINILTANITNRDGTTYRKDYTYSGELYCEELYYPNEEDPDDYFICNFDDFGRMVERITIDNRNETYVYDGDGLRISKSKDGVTTTYIYDGMYVVAEITGDDVTVYNRGSTLYGQITNGDSKRLLPDQHNDIVSTYSSTGTIGSASYDAFGNVLSSTITDLPFGYTSEYTDDSGLIYLRARYYEPETGRFISEDPIMDGTNWYVYCGNNPVMFVDPLGLAPSELEAALMAEHVYNHNWDEPIENRRVYDMDGNYTGWRMIDMFTNESLKIGVYVRGDGKDELSTYTGPMEYVLSYRGTDPTSIEDWKNNLQQFIGEHSKHLSGGVIYTSWFVNDRRAYEITFTGHSKGGGEAAVNAEIWNKNAIVFNPSIPYITWLLSDDEYVKPYVVTNEILNYALGEIPLGTTKYLKQQYNGWLPGTTLIDRFNNHSMQAVINGLIQGGYR